MQKIKEWFAALQARERIAVIAAVALVSLMAIYVFGLAPFYRVVKAQEESIAKKKDDVAWMRDAAPKVQMLSMSQPGIPTTGEPLVVLVSRTARDAGLGDSLTNQTPSGATAIRINLKDAAFDSLMVWLSGLQLSQGVTIESANISRSAQPGLVNVSLQLNRAGG